MVLILLSQFWGGEKTESPPQGAVSGDNLAQFTSEDYIRALENKLCGLMGSIKGVGQVQIMVTLENTGEYVYAQEEKRNVDKNVEPGVEGAPDKSYLKENVQQTYILMNGQKEALVRTHLEPKVQGVVVICEGADNILVQQSVINVVTTALNIPTTRVCVEKIA
jgi:stage III sporulation protein AG